MFSMLIVIESPGRQVQIRGRAGRRHLVHPSNVWITFAGCCSAQWKSLINAFRRAIHDTGLKFWKPTVSLSQTENVHEQKGLVLTGAKQSGNHIIQLSLNTASLEGLLFKKSRQRGLEMIQTFLFFLKKSCNIEFTSKSKSNSQ